MSSRRSRMAPHVTPSDSPTVAAAETSPSSSSSPPSRPSAGCWLFDSLFDSKVEACRAGVASLSASLVAAVLDAEVASEVLTSSKPPAPSSIRTDSGASDGEREAAEGVEGAEAIAGNEDDKEPQSRPPEVAVKVAARLTGKLEALGRAEENLVCPPGTCTRVRRFIRTCIQRGIPLAVDRYTDAAPFFRLLVKLATLPKPLGKAVCGFMVEEGAVLSLIAFMVGDAPDLPSEVVDLPRPCRSISEEKGSSSAAQTEGGAADVVQVLLAVCVHACTCDLHVVVQVLLARSLAHPHARTPAHAQLDLLYVRLALCLCGWPSVCATGSLYLQQALLRSYM